MTSVFVVRDEQVLLLYRHGSRAITDSWVGIGGHLEPDEIADPTAGVLRELHEEVGPTSHDIDGLSLRYVSIRDTGNELRHTYYYTATLRPYVAAPVECSEGRLRWFDLDFNPASLEMPPTAQVAFGHWLKQGRHDRDLRFILIDNDGQQTGPL